MVMSWIWTGIILTSILCALILGNGGALAANHLYMMTISDRGVKATAATTKVLVRGTYEVK